MLWLRSHIEKIRNLMADGTSESLTYAALECRLALERICYERLRIAHDYISHKDIRKWQPRDVVNTLIQEVDIHIASTFTFSVAPEQAGDNKGKGSPKRLEKLKYKELGTQVGFDPKKIGQLWNALSSFLHVNIPKNKQAKVIPYGDKTALRRKLDEALAELNRLAKGTLISSGMGETVSFTCNCGSLNKRRVSLLKDKQVINCINPECNERWVAIFEGDEIGFERKTISVQCQSCSKSITFAEKEMLGSAPNQPIDWIWQIRFCAFKQRFGGADEQSFLAE